MLFLSQLKPPSSSPLGHTHIGQTYTNTQYVQHHMHRCTSASIYMYTCHTEYLSTLITLYVHPWDFTNEQFPGCDRWDDPIVIVCMHLDLYNPVMNRSMCAGMYLYIINIMIVTVLTLMMKGSLS